MNLIYTDEKSNKFWRIEVVDTEFFVNFGRVGTDGQYSSKSFSDKETCEREAQKLINSKLKKGYVEEQE